MSLQVLLVNLLKPFIGPNFSEMLAQFAELWLLFLVRIHMNYSNASNCIQSFCIVHISVTVEMRWSFSEVFNLCLPGCKHDKVLGRWLQQACSCYTGDPIRGSSI